MNGKRRKALENDINIYKRIVMLIFFVLFIRLGWLQLVEVDIYRTKAEDNRMRLITIPATRGNIITNDGVVIATDHPSFQVSITYLGLKNQDQVVNRLAEILNDPEITPEYINNLIKEHKYRLYEPIVVKRNLSIETVTAIETRRGELPGVTIEPAPERKYLYGNLAGHVLGYLSEINEELGKEGYEEYKLGDLIGKIGIEKEYDKYLRGKNGFRQVEVNVKNRPIREVTTISPKPGNNVILTIDFDLQKAMDEAFDNVLAELQKNPKSDKANAGAAILLDVKTGKVLAMSTRPDDRITVQNKAIQGRYIPGSTFKMVTGIAALEEGKVTPEEIIYNPGRYWYPPYIKSVAPVGPINFYSAIAKSDNVYFQEMGRRVGIDAIARIGSELGLDKPTGIDLPFENQGVSPLQGLPTIEKRLEYFDWAAMIVNKRYEGKIKKAEEEYNKLIAQTEDSTEKEKLEWKKENEIKRLKAQWEIDLKWNTSWHDVDTFNIAIGQGRQNYTPLQIANYVATIANNGIRYKPYVAEKIISPDGKIIKEFKPEIIGKANISPKTFDVIKKAMIQTTQPGGTAYSLFSKFPKEIKVAAKTGTAQPGQAGYRVGDKQYYDGLFVAFAPADDPEIVFAGVVEFGYSGGGSAGRIAKAVFEEYFGLKEKDKKGNNSTSYVESFSLD
ncbi:MAG: penicillin-binding protein 2 [Clostridia bacterium]|nr:penicillin-binding protein 2 [Clostridia bacterium]MDN5323739.1 penicillin-binding protein 2 [Clostridia bacterium]